MPAARRIAITGACSTLARSVIDLRDRDPRVAIIEALDIRRYEGRPSAKLQYQKADVRDLPALRCAFRGRRVVIPGMLNRLTLKLIPEGVMLRPFMKKRWRYVRDHQSAWKHC